jgi:hypothetical protein
VTLPARLFAALSRIATKGLAYIRNVRLSLLVVVLALVGGFLLGRAGSGATPSEKASRDSLALVSRALDRAVHVADSIRARQDSLTGAAVAVAAGKVGPARTHTDTELVTVERLVPDTGALRRAWDAVPVAVAAERAHGDTLIASLAADTLFKAQSLSVAYRERDAYRSQRDEAQRQLAAALKRRTEPPVTIGATAGGVAVYSGGRILFGPGAAAGLTVRVRIPLPRFLGG